MVEIGQQSVAQSPSSDLEKDHPGPSRKTKPGLGSIQEGEALEEGSEIISSEHSSAKEERPSGDLVAMSERLTISPATVEQKHSSGMSSFGLGSIQEEISHATAEQKSSARMPSSGLGAGQEETSETEPKEEICKTTRPSAAPDSTTLSELSLPRSLKSAQKKLPDQKREYLTTLGLISVGIPEVQPQRNMLTC